MKRWHEEKHRMHRQSVIRIHTLRDWWESADKPNANLKAEPGRFRKRKALDCGQAGCSVCHGEKPLHRNDGKGKSRITREMAGELE